MTFSKPIDPDDKYVVRLMFGCGEGHVLPPNFSYWESGEACPHGHHPGLSNRDAHLYGRLVAVPTKTSQGEDLWEKLLANPDKWAQLPLAPKGAKEGDVIGTRERTS